MSSSSIIGSPCSQPPIIMENEKNNMNMSSVATVNIVENYNNNDSGGGGGGGCNDKTEHYVFLMINLAIKATKHTEIRISLNPEAVVFERNQPDSSQNLWVIILRVKGFKNYVNALEFYNYWESKTRGTTSRIAKALELGKFYAKNEQLTIIVTPYTKEEQLERIKSKKENLIETKNNNHHHQYTHHRPCHLQHKNNITNEDSVTTHSNDTINGNNTVDASATVKTIDLTLPNKILLNGKTISQIYEDYGFYLNRVKNQKKSILISDSNSINNSSNNKKKKNSINKAVTKKKNKRKKITKNNDIVTDNNNGKKKNK